MEKITKDNRAITLVSLILTIVILLILASAITYSVADSINSAYVTEFISKMQIMQQKVDSFVEGKTTEEINNLSIGNKNLTITQLQAIKNAKNNNEINGETTDFIYFNKQELANQFDVEDIDDEYIINFKTREVVCVNEIEYKGNIYYTQYLLPNGQTIKQYDSTRINRNITFDISKKIDGLNAKITVSNVSIVNATLSYKENNDEYWNTITNYTEKDKEYTISIEKAGKYILKIKDNTSEKYKESDPIKIELINEPVIDGNKVIIESENNYDYSQDSTHWIYAEDSEAGPYYVWVPKFAYTDTDKTPKFIRGTTNVATDNTYINTESEEEEWIISDKFDNATGMWVQVENPNSDTLNLVELINT